MAPSDRLSINGVEYRVVDSSKIRTGRRTYQEITRPSQPHDGQIKVARWRLNGELGKSREDAETGLLACDYTTGLDHHYDMLLTSGAARNNVDPGVTGTTHTYGVPISDVQKTSWSEGAGDADGSAFDELDEGIISGTPDDATSYWTTSTSDAEIILGITSLSAPNIDDFHKIRVRYQFPATMTGVKVTLYQSTTKIVSFTYNPNDYATAATWVTQALTLPLSYVRSITDWTALRIGVQFTAGTGSLDLSAIEYDQIDGSPIISIKEDRGAIFAPAGQYCLQFNPNSGGNIELIASNDRTNTITSHELWQGSAWIGFGDVADSEEITAVTGTGASFSTETDVRFYQAAAGPDRLWTVDAENADRKVRYAVDTLSSANWSNAFQVADPGVATTGIYTIGPYMILGTEDGPRSFTASGKPQILGETTNGFRASENGASGDSIWGWHYHATKLGLVAIDPDSLVENPVGPGEGRDGQNFEGPIDGYPTAVRAFKGFLWVAYLTTAGDAYLLRGQFGPLTGRTGRPEWYVFQYLSGVTCKAIGSTAGRDAPAILWGEDDTLSWADLAFRQREIADTSNYVFSTAGGQWFGSTMMRAQGKQVTVRAGRFLTENCDASNTWQLAVSMDEGSYVNVGSAVQSDGLQTVRPVSGGAPLATVTGMTLKPRLTQVAASTSSPPQIRGFLDIEYDERPEFVREIDVLVEWQRGGDLKNLQALVGDGTTVPVTLRLPTQTDVNTDLYGYVASAEVYDRTDPTDQVILLKVVEWLTS